MNIAPKPDTETDLARRSALDGTARDRLNVRALAQPEAVTALRHRLVAYAEKVGAGEAVREAVRLAASEALTNVVLHAYPENQPGDMTAEAWRDDDQHLTIVILDEGQGFGSATRHRGMGLGCGLMAQLADDFVIASRNGTPGTIVSLRFRLL
jgi:anti-sigma regulatory factor (Ser/Thr protein kinase)